MFSRFPVKQSGAALLFTGGILMTKSISLLMISLFKLFISSWFSLGRLYVSRNLSISSRLSNLLMYNCSIFLCVIFKISAVSVVISSLSFFMLVSWVLSLFSLMSLAEGLLILSFQKISSWFCLSFLFFVSVLFISPLIKGYNFESYLTT